MSRAKSPTKGRAPSGLGTIGVRKDGRYWARISLDDGTRKAYYGRTEAEVREKLIKALGEKQKGTLVTEKIPSLSEFTARWLVDVAKPRLKASTHLRYTQLLDKHVLPTLGKVRLNKLTPQHLHRLYREKLAAGLAPRSVGHIHRVLHVALETALRWDLVSRNVCDLVDPPRVDRGEYQVLNPEQARRFLQAVQDDPLEAYYIVALTTGMRAGELRALRWSDLDMAQGTVTIRRSERRVYGLGWQETEPKTRSGWRVLPLIQPAITALHAHRARQLEQRLQMGALWQEGWRAACPALERSRHGAGDGDDPPQ